ncbi:MAG TPA: mechanosensitive ion channel family protein [Salinivirgaceae bacterium]|nr:mechanosensitive ion channel family protein [Salinivirgaceae bacterium]
MNSLREQLLQYFGQIGVPESMQISLSNIVFVISLLITGFILHYIIRYVVLKYVEYFIKKTKVTWDDKFLERKVFTRAATIVPILYVFFMIPQVVQVENEKVIFLLQKIVRLFIVIWGARLVNSIILALNDIYDELEAAKERPIKGIIQTIQIIVFIIAAIVFISILLNKSVGYLLAGLGTMTAVLMLVFKDSLMGLTAGIQMAANRTVRIGDWIVLPSHNADGIVTEITLNFVKVQNWDYSITVLPSYTLVSTAFQNWRGMEESGGRRIKRHLLIDQTSVKYCTPEMIERFKKIDLIKDYVEQRLEEIEKHNKEHQVNTELPINGRRMTNLGTFRRYVYEYVRNHPLTNTNLTLVVRHLQPTEKGLPLEIYIFSKEKSLVPYEGFQSDILEHLLAAIEIFELKLFQAPTSYDMKQLAEILSKNKN